MHLWVFFFLEIRDVSPPGILVTLATMVCVCVLVFQSCPILCNPMDCSPPGSSVHGILQARVLEWVAISSSRGSSWPRDQTCVSCISCTGRRILYPQGTWNRVADKRRNSLKILFFSEKLIVLWILFLCFFSWKWNFFFFNKTWIKVSSWGRGASFDPVGQ